MIITNKNKISANHKKEYPNYEYKKYEVTPRSNEAQVYTCIYEILPQKSAYPYHYHQNVTEVFYIINGEGIIVSDNKETKTISAGDVIVCPPKCGHKIINTSKTELLTYLDVDTISQTDIVNYPDSNKVGMIINNESATFFKKKDATDYYDGE